MANGQRGMYPPMQGGGFNNPYMKGPDWGAGIRDFMQQLTGVRQMREQQKQQKWQRGIVEREIALKEEEARKKPPQPKLTRFDFQKQYAQYMNSTGQWDETQTGEYLATNKVPQVPVQVSPETRAEIEKFFGLKDFNQETPDDQEGYIKTYALQKHKQQPGKPVERESLKLRQDRDKLVSPLVERYQRIAGEIDAAIYELGDREDEKYPQYQRKLHNAKKVLDIAQYAQSIVDGGDELDPRLRKLIQQLAYKTRDIQTGKFFSPDKNGYTLGEIRQNAAGETRMYVGNNQWLIIK